MMSSSKTTSNFNTAPRLGPPLANWPATLLIFLLLVGGGSSWRVLDEGPHQLRRPQKNLTRAGSSSSEFDSSWRLAGLGAERAPNRARASPIADVNIVSLNKTNGRAPLKEALEAVEWDDETPPATANEADNETEFAFKELDQNSPAVADLGNMPSASNLIDSAHANQAHKFALKDSRTLVNSVSSGKVKRVSPYQFGQFKLASNSNNNRHESGALETRPLDAGNLFASPLINPSKLIYHGRLAGVDGGGSGPQKRMVAGLEVHIDTHQPVAISRRAQFSAPLETSSKGPSSEFMSRSGAGDRIKESSGETNSTVTTAPIPRGLNELAASSPQEQSASSSDWRPIVMASSRARRSGKTHKQLDSPLNAGPSSEFRPLNKLDEAGQQQDARATVPMTDNELKKAAQLSKLDSDASKWRPITGLKQRGAGKRQLEAANKPSGWKKVDSDSSPFKPTKSKPTKRLAALEFARKIEQPFDRDDEFDLDQRDTQAENERHPTGQLGSWAHSAPDQLGPAKQSSADRWTPLDTTTTATDLVATGSSSTTTAASVEQTTQWPVYSNGTTNSSSEAAQRSASDLSYIYSSQPAYGTNEPVQQQLVQQPMASAGSSYYGQSYGQVSAPQQQPQLDVSSAIIDTTSGQTPEMVPDRLSPEPGPQRSSYGGSFSDLQSVSFPTVQQAPTPSRLPAYYGGYGNQALNVGVGPAAFDSSNNYQQPPRNLQQPVQQSPRQLASAPPQVVRQEHHYHYYNQPTPASASSPNDRQLNTVSSPAQQVAPQPTVIRELQPIMITQPAAVVQQAPSTTQAPQIIREIIKEVPVQTVQVQPVQMATRFVMQSPPLQPATPVIPPPVASLIREVGSLETSSFVNNPPSSYGTAKRFMRQLSESMPQVAIRMPAQSQFRLQVPAIQLPSSLRTNTQPTGTTGVTRQTGSFIVPPRPKKTTTLMTETQDIPVHTTIIHSTQYTPATRTTLYTTDHQTTSYRS